VTPTRRPSPQTVAVLTALAADPFMWRYGYELGQQVGVKAGARSAGAAARRGQLRGAW
jgi:PadR family transcriptional regulator, regulatory protein PadR